MRNQQEITTIIDDYIQRGLFPGAEYAIIEGAKVSHFIEGNASIQPTKVPLTSGKKWDLASVTKVVGTGTAIIDLVFAGKLELDRPLQKYYPEFTDSTVSIRQLLTHTSGINPYIPHRNELTKEELISAINHIEVTPDKQFNYTDINFILLGFLLEKLYGKNLADIFKEQIFEQRKMLNTSFGPVTNAVPTSLATPKGTVHDPKARVLGEDCGAAGLFSTLDDLVAFAQMYFEEKKYLKLLKNYAIGEKSRSLAWDLPTSDHDWLLHTGYTGTFLLINPRKKKAVIFLSNRVHLKDERLEWIKARDILIHFLITQLTDD